MRFKEKHTFRIKLCKWSYKRRATFCRTWSASLSTSSAQMLLQMILWHFSHLIWYPTKPLTLRLPLVVTLTFQILTVRLPVTIYVSRTLCCQYLCSYIVFAQSRLPRCLAPSSEYATMLSVNNLDSNFQNKVISLWAIDTSPSNVAFMNTWACVVMLYGNFCRECNRTVRWAILALDSLATRVFDEIITRTWLV